MQKLYFHVFFGVLVLCGSTSLAQENTFEKFLKNAMTGYTTWLTENKLDPSPSMPFTITLKTGSSSTDTVVKFDKLELKNQRVKGHSSKDSSTSVIANLARKSISIERTTSLTFEGTYTAKGSITTGGIPFTIDSKGKYEIPVEDEFIENIYYETYKVVNDTIDLTGSTKQGYSTSGIKSNLVFNGLLDVPSFDPYKDEIEAEIIRLHNKYMVSADGKRSHQSRQLLDKFLTETLGAITVTELAQWPLPTTTSTTPRSSGVRLVNYWPHFIFSALSYILVR